MRQAQQLAQRIEEDLKKLQDFKNELLQNDLKKSDSENKKNENSENKANENAENKSKDTKASSEGELTKKWQAAVEWMDSQQWSWTQGYSNPPWTVPSQTSDNNWAISNPESSKPVWWWSSSSWGWSTPKGKQDCPPPPSWPGWEHYRTWKQELKQWRQITESPTEKLAAMVLSILPWDLKPKFDHITESELNSNLGIIMILEKLDWIAGIQPEDEKRSAFHRGIYKLSIFRFVVPLMLLTSCVLVGT